MTYAFGIYFEDDDNLGLVAAGSRWTSGGNSAAARRARVAMQRRDRYGRWAEMGGGIAFSGRNSNNQVIKMVGRYVGPAERPEYMRVYVTSGRGIQTGIYEVPSKVATVAKALLGEDALKDVGVKLDVNGKTVGDILDRDIEYIAGMFKGKPNDFELDMARKNLTKAENKVIAKARLRAPAHKSYNIVDKDGNRIDKDEEPTKPDVKKPSKKAKPAKVFPIPDLSKLDPKEQARLVWYEGKNGKPILPNMLTEADKTPENKRIYDRENNRIIDGNGKLIEFKGSFNPDASPIPKQLPEHDPEEGFWNINAVDPKEVRKDLKNAQEVYEHLFNGGFAEVDLALAIEAFEYSRGQAKYIGRDENPLFQSNPTDPRLRAIADIFEALPPGQEARLKRAINLGFMNEENIDKLKAWLDEKVEPGSPLSKEDMTELHDKFRNLAVDLTNMRIKGQDAFSNDNMGAERIDMPQLNAEDLPLFLQDMAKMGVGYKETRMMPDQLHPIQAEMDMGDVANIAESWRDDKLYNDYRPDEAPIVISRDGYVLDGHHRWAAAWLAQKRGDKYALKGLKVVQLDIDHEQALEIANEWSDYAGVARLTVGGKKVREPRPAKVEAPTTTPISYDPDEIPANYAPDDSPPSDGDNVVTPSGENFKNWLDRELANNGDKILTDYSAKLTNDTPNVDEPRSPFPGSRTAVKNLLKYRDALIKKLKENALDGDEAKFKFTFAVAKRVTNLLNQIHENFANDRRYGFGTELEIPTSNPLEKLKTLRILPETMVMNTDNNGIQRIESFQALIIAKNGKPYLIKWTDSNSKAYSIGLDGTPNSTNDGGGTSFGSVQSYQDIVDGKPVPYTASVGGAYTETSSQALGLGGAHIYLTRWVQSQFNNGRLQHSGNLSNRGNAYSKQVSRDMRSNNRSQADKAVHMSSPNADIFKVLKDMGLVGGEYIPATPGAAQDDDTPGGYGRNSGGRGWLKRLTFANNSGFSDNQSVLTKFSLNAYVDRLDTMFLAKSPEEQQAILDAMPPIFRDFFTGDRSRNPEFRFEDFDVQYNMLATAYTDGMKKQEAVDFLNTLIDGLPQLYTAFGQDLNSVNGMPERLVDLGRLRDAVNARAWDQANNNYNRPLPFTPNSIRTLESPFAGHFKFNEWTLPGDVNRVLNDLPFAPKPRNTSQHPDWTEDPQRLQAQYSPETLLNALRDSILNRKGKFASLPPLSTDENGVNNVNPTAVYKALENHGYDTEKILAGIYDELNGNTTNTDALLAKRNELGNLQDIIERLRREVGQVDAPVEFSRIGGDYDPTTRILQSDLVKRGEGSESELPTGLKLQPLALDNDNYDYLNLGTNTRNLVIQSAPYSPQIALSKFYIDGVTDNPNLIARNFNPTGLRNALVDAVTNGRDSVKLRFPNGSEILIKNAAIRDALQLQGYDINKVLAEQPNLRQTVRDITIVNGNENVDGNGTSVVDWGIDTDRPTGPGLRQKVNSITGNYEISVVNLSDPSKSTIAQLAKITKNQDGKFEVWVAKKSDGKTDDFTGEPSGIYSNLENAVFDVKRHVETELNLRTRGNFFNQATRPAARPDYEIIGGKDDEPQVTVGDLVLTRPEGADSFVVYSNDDIARGFRRIPGSEDGISAGNVYTQSVEQSDDSFSEVFKHVSKGENGELKERQVFAITKIGDKYRLTTGRLSGVSVADDVIDNLTFNNYEDAKDFAIRRFTQGKIGFTGSKNFPNLRTASSERTAASADLANQQIVQDATSIQISTPVNSIDGIAGDLKINIQKGAHPTWANNVVNPPYVFAEFSFSPPGSQSGDTPYLTGKIVRTGRMQWEVRIEGKTDSFGSDANLFINNYLRTTTMYESSKEDAVNSLRRRLNLTFGVTDQQKEQGDSVLPQIRLVNRAAELEPRPTPPAPTDPTLLADGVFDEFLAVRNTPLDIPDATSRGYMGLGQSMSSRFETPDGKNYKVKDEGSRKAASESLNHALHLVLGIPATPARTGKAPGTRNQVNLIDPFEPDIVRGAVNGNMNGQELFTNANFSQPENQQAIADIQEGLIIDYWLGNVDFVLNTGNSFVAVRDGVRRGVRCDVGGGMFSAIRQQLIGDWPNGDDAVREFKYFNGDFMGIDDRVNHSTTAGHMRRGLTKAKYIEIAKRTLLRLTDDKIDRLVDAHITDPTDADRAKQGLKARRLALLNYLGIDPNQAPPTGAQAAPSAAVDANPQLARDGYEFVGENAQGKKIVRVPGSMAPDGIFIASINIPENVRDGIIDGSFVPENLPFRAMDRTDPTKDIVIDGAGIVRPVSALTVGYTSLLIRKKLSNGAYNYLIVSPNADRNSGAHDRANINKVGPIVAEHARGQALPTAKEIINKVFGTPTYGPGDRVVGEKEILLDIPGLLGKQRVLVADVDDFDMSATRDFAVAQGRIASSIFLSANFIKNTGSSFQTHAPGDASRIENKLKQWEQNWNSTASNVPTGTDNKSGGDDGSGPSNPGGGDGGGSPSGPPASGSSSDWQSFSRISFMSRRPGFPETQTRLEIFTRADGAIAVDDSNSGNTIGHIKPLQHGHWVATFMPGLIGDNNNGNAAKAFFANKKDAENWLTKKIYDLNYADPRGGERIAARIGVSGDRSYDQNAPQPPFVVDRGYLNPTTPAQIGLAKRLVKGKKATPEERAMYKAILSQRNPTVGDVGWIIGQLREREDRDSAELAASKQAQKDALNAGNPIRESSLDNGGDGSNRERTVLAKNLQVGERILGNINADVVFTVPGENDTINVGVVGDDGKLKVYKVNRNRGLVCIYGRQAPVAPAQQVTPHPAIIARANRSRLIQESIKAQYPNTHTLPNGDLVIGQRDHRQADGRVFRYEAVVHKLKSDEFVGYVRRQLLDANGNPTGIGEAAYLTKPAHSARALGNRLSGRVIPALMANNPANGFNQPNGDRQNEAIDPATGLPLPESLVSQTRFVGNTGIETTGHPAKDALIEYVQTLVARGVSAPDIINQVVGTNQNLFSRQQMDDIIERLEANRLYPGVNVIPYVSKDNKTIVRVGDRVTHFDAFGQPKLMPNGLPRTGTVTERRPYTLNVKPNGDYEYTDQIFVKWDDTDRPHQAAPRRVEVNRRADGSAPVPAVQDAVPGETPPYIETMPMQPRRVIPRPVAPGRQQPPAPANSQDIANIGNVRILVVPNGPTYSVDRGDEYTQFQDVNDAGNYSGIYVIKVSNGGKWLVKRRDGVDVQVLAEFDNRNEAEANAMDLITQNGGGQTDERLENRPATPVVFPEVGETAQQGTTISSNNIGEFSRVIDPSGMGHTIMRGVNMTRFDKDQGDWRDDAIYVQQLGDGKWRVLQQIPNGNGGHDTRNVAISEDRNLMEAVATNIVAGNATAEDYMAAWGDPNQPVAPENNDSGITPLIERFNANRMPTDFSLARSEAGDGFLGRGGSILLNDAKAGAAGLNSVKGRITQNENGNFIVQKWGSNGGFVGREEYPDVMTALEVLSQHATSLRNERDGENRETPQGPSLRNAIDASPTVRDFNDVQGGEIVTFPGRNFIAFTHPEQQMGGGRITDIEDLENGMFRVSDWTNVQSFNFENKEEAIQKVEALLTAFNARMNRNQPSSSDKSPSGDGGGDGGVPPTNPPTGGDGGASDGPGLDLNPGNWRQGEPSQGVVRLDGRVPKVNTFWDDDQPPTKYEVIRTSDSTNFVGVAGDNAGAVAFMRVEKTENGNWKVVDPRNREGIDTDEFPTPYASRNVAEALAINKMAGRQELNRDILNQPDSNVPPALEENAQVPVLDIPWNDKRMAIQPQEVGAIRSFELINDQGNGSLEPIKIEIVRDPASTRFLPEGLNYEDIEVTRNEFTNNWEVSGITENPYEIKTFRTRAEAEAAAVNSMLRFNQDAKDAYVARQNNRPAPQALPNGIVESRSEGMTLYNNPDGSINEIQVIAIGNGKAWQVTRNRPGQNPEVLSTRATREDGESEARARIAQENAPVAPAGPAATDSESQTSGKSDSELRVGEFRGPDGMIENREADGNFTADFNIGQSTFQRVRKPDGNASYFYNGTEIATIEKNSDGTFNVKTIWAKNASDFVVARDEENALLSAQSQIWQANQDGRIEQMDQGTPPAGPSGGDGGNPFTEPGDRPFIPFDGRGRPKPRPGGTINIDGLGTPVGPAERDGGGGAGVPPQTPPAGPLDGLPVAEDTPANVNGVVVRNGEQKFNISPNGEPEELREISQPSPNSRYVTGNGEAYFENEDGTVWPANWTTMLDNLPPVAPVVPEPKAPQAPQAVPAQAPRLPRPRVNPVQPGDRYVRYNVGRDGNNWDIVDSKTRRKIGRAKNREEAEQMRDGLRDLKTGKLIDYNTPITPRTRRPATQENPNVAPTQRGADVATRNDLGDGVFSITNQDAEYGLAVRQSDGTWSARVHENPRDAMNNRNPIISGTYATEQEAEDAIRQAIAERQAQRDAANVLQWQSGSDGKQYLGLDGVAGVDAENGPVYGISPSPFGGWALARWDTKASKDAGAQPNSIVAQPNEEAAKNDALQQINDFLRNLTGQNPPLVNDENPTTSTNREEQLPPGTTLQDQVDAGVTTPFNPNATLPGSNPPKA